jgi:hypothetical protein
MEASASASGADLQPVLLPVSANKNGNYQPATHSEKRQAGKRPREDTPSPQKQGNNDTDWHGRIDGDVTWIKKEIGTATRNFKHDKIFSLAESVKDFLNITLVKIVERQASTNSDLATEVIRLTAENNKLNNKVVRQDEDIQSVKLCKEKVEVKASKKEMEEKVKTAVTQVKATNINFEKEIVDRKELISTAKQALATKVRSDLRAEYDERIKTATIKVLSSKTFKATVDGKDIWTAPIVISSADRDNRWGLENCLRSSKVFPGFHWPSEMVDNVKVFRKVVKDMGYPDSTHYIRIRPDERDGSWRIRADVKPKEGNSKFVAVASFDIPPIDAELKTNVSGWAKPTWTKKAGTQPAAATSRGAAAAAATATGGANVDFTEDIEVDNL